MNKEKLGKQIETLRKECGVSTYELEQKGIHPSLPATIEKGKKGYSIDTLIKYLNAIDEYILLSVGKKESKELQNTTTPAITYSECYAQTYLTHIPQDVDKYGFCKTLAVRREVIHIKHIFTEIFVRKTIDIQNYLDKIGWNLFDYMEYITNRLRKVHYFSREYINDINEIVKADRDRFFPTIQLYNGLNCVIVLDFDGVVTENSFSELYKLCIERCKTEICSANPEIKSSWFDVRNLPLPNKINSCKGKLKKIFKLIELNQKNDYVFYIDNEKEYLEFAWLFGIQTYIYENKQIKYFSLKSK